MTALVGSLACATAAAQLVVDPDWKESEVPPPPALRTNQLIAIDAPAYLSVRYGVDAGSIQVTPDGIVRYVLVARPPEASITASYEGVRCSTGEYKVYARYTPSGRWVAEKSSEWEAMRANSRGRMTYQLAKQGLCNGRAPSGATGESIAYQLKSTPVDHP